MPNARQTSLIASPSSSRATNRRRSSITEHSFHGINASPGKGKGVTHVSGTICHLCLGPLRTAPAIPGIGFFDDLCRQILVLLLDRPRAVDLRIDQGVGHADVVVTNMGVIGAKILGETPVPMAEFISRRGEGGDEYIH